MLTRSPVPPSPANSSPRSSFHSFHYASGAGHHQSPSRISVLLPRRQSTSSASGAMPPSPAQPRPKRYVGVDASTQYSPMETAANEGAAPPPPQQQPQQQPGSQRAPPPPPSPPGPMPMIDNDGDGNPSRPQPAKVSPSLPKQSYQPPDPSCTTSPNKRRNSQGPGGGSSGVSTAATLGSPVLAKRAKPDDAPPKVLPEQYEFCPVEDVVVLIANMLGELIETNDALALKSGHLTRFHSRTAPGISVLDYLHRLAKHATLTPPLLLSMVYYIDRLCVSYPDFTINTLTVHRFLITSATVAAKGLSDSFWNNSTYARVGGVRIAELKMLELEFLYRVDWKIVPNPEVLVSYYRGLVERCPGYVLQGDEGSGDEDDSDDIEDDNSDEAGEGDDLTAQNGGDGRELRPPPAALAD